MELRFSPLFSGSSGNSIYVGCDGANILVDAGISGSRVAKALTETGVQPGALDGILITPEHVDHIRGVGVLSRKYDVPVFATPALTAPEETSTTCLPLFLKSDRVLTSASIRRRFR